MLHPQTAARIIEGFLRQPGLAVRFSNPHDPTVWERLYKYIEAMTWWQVYDFVEEIHAAEIKNASGGGYGVPPIYYDAQNFVREVNKVFDQENIPYELNASGEILYRGSAPFETAVTRARSVLRATGRRTADNEIQEALRDLVRRPNPDLTGAVHHSIAALECVANDICGEKDTLGEVIKRHPEKFPEPLSTAISKLYGFASQKGRHILEGSSPDLKEVELVVGVAATVATYMIRANSSGA